MNKIQITPSKWIAFQFEMESVLKDVSPSVLDYEIGDNEIRIGDTIFSPNVTTEYPTVIFNLVHSGLKSGAKRILRDLHVILNEGLNPKWISNWNDLIDSSEDSILILMELIFSPIVEKAENRLY